MQQKKEIINNNNNNNNNNMFLLLLLLLFAIDHSPLQIITNFTIISIVADSSNNKTAIKE